MKQIIRGVKKLLMISAFALFTFLPSAVLAQDLSQGYQTDDSLQTGMVIGIVQEDSSKVEAISTAQIERIHGVVVDANDAPFTLGDDQSSVYVATSGRFEVLVSDANGPIKAGDFLSTSDLPGIAQKATEDQALVLGKALQDYVPSNGSEVLSQQTDTSGNQVSLGSVIADLTVSRNPNEKEATQDAPDFLNRASELIADKPVSPIRQYISLVILVLVAAISGSLIYASVRSSITAIGRNPLSRKSIVRSLLQVVLISFVILFSGLFTVYLILRL